MTPLEIQRLPLEQDVLLTESQVDELLVPEKDGNRKKRGTFDSGMKWVGQIPVAYKLHKVLEGTVPCI